MKRIKITFGTFAVITAMLLTGTSMAQSQGANNAFPTNGDVELNGTFKSNVAKFADRVYIGKVPSSDDGYSLSVDGKIRSTEVKVYTGWADFVFENDYDLLTLEEVEAYIKANGHLKDIPSADHVEQNGINVGEMNKLLLQKIEELTLYVIALNKEIEVLKAKN